MQADELSELIESARATSVAADHSQSLTRLDAAICSVDDDGERGALLLTRAIVRQGEMDPAVAAEDCHRAFILLRAGDRPAEAALAAAIAAGMLHRTGDVGRSVDLAVEAMLLTGQHLDDGRGARAANALAIVFAQMCAFDLAHELASTAFDTAVAPQVKEVSAYTAGYVTVEGVHAGVDLDRALLARAAEWLCDTGASDVGRSILGPGLRAEHTLLDGGSPDWFDHADPVLDETAPRLVAWYRLVAGTVLRSRDDLSSALAELDASVPVLVAVGDHHRVHRAYGERSTVRARLGDVDGALADANEMARLARSEQVSQMGGLADQITARVELEVSQVALNRRATALAEAVSVDALTGVGSRRRLDSALDELAMTDGRVSIAIFDLDRFKQVNDTHGHSVGDEVLERFGRILGEAARVGDLVGRYGGEEFVAVFPGSGRDVATAYARRIRSSLAHEPWAELADGLTITVSVGVASGRLPTVREVLRRADRALYQAKTGGRDRVVTI